MTSLDRGYRSPTRFKEATQAKPARFAALDIFRGLCIFWMVLVNSPGDPAQVFTPIRHVEWHGWTLADLVAPGFLWVVGVAIPLAIGKYLDAGLPRGRLQLRILRRSATLYALDVPIFLILAPYCSACSPVWAHIPVLGILQRIAVCYLVAASVFLWSGLRGVVVAMLVFLGIYLGVLYGLTSFYNLADPFAHQDNFAIYFHAIVLGPTVNAGQALVTVLTGIVTMLSGVIVGCRLRNTRHLAGRESLMLLLVSVACIGSGYVLDAWIPINRYLWTPSFVLLTSGISMALFTVLSHLARWDLLTQAAKPLIVLGRNPITVYFLSSVLYGLAMSVGATGPQGNWVPLWTMGYLQFLRLNIPPRVASLALAFMYAVSLYFVARSLDRRGWYIRT